MTSSAIDLHMLKPIYKGPEHVTYFRTIQAFEGESAQYNGSNLVSTEYNFDILKLGKFDIGRFPEIAEKYRISDSSLSRQLPTVILFKNGKEVERHPKVDAKGKLLKFFFSADNGRASFNLNNMYKQCVEDKQKQSKAQQIMNITTNTIAAIKKTQ
uniref:Thioredoxin domain-containing protein n=1 Tax=Glossina palpalis gambiensis TaxID=67801 RepID=A0A1B0ATX1_9MUSC